MTDAPAKSRRRWFRFSVRSLLLLVAFIAIPLAWKFNRVRNQRLVVAGVMRTNAWTVVYSNGLVQAPSKVYWQTRTRGPQWLRDWLGDDFFADIVAVYVRDGAAYRISDTTLFNIARLPALESLLISSSEMTDDGLKQLAFHRRLKTLTLEATRVTGRGLKHIATLKGLRKLSFRLPLVGDLELQSLANLKDIESLGLYFMPRITDKGLGRIARLESLRGLRLDGLQITDKGLGEIANLKNLRQLTPHRLSITDTGLCHLYGMKKLESLELRATYESMDGANDLAKALPNCKLTLVP